MAAGFPSTVAPIVQNGLVPVFVDVAWRLQRGPRAAPGGRRAAYPGDHAGPHAGRTVRPRRCDGAGEGPRPVADRGQLRRAGLALPGRPHRHLWSPGHLVVLSRPPHHDRRGRHGRDQRRGAGPDRPLHPGLGPRLLLRGWREQHLRQAVQPAVRQPAVRLRPQVRLQPPRLQPQGDGHAGGHRLRPAAPARGVRGRAQAQPCPAARGAPAVRGPPPPARGPAAHGSPPGSPS